MFGKLTNEEEQCIDDILTSGLNEINDVPSLALSSMSIQSTPCYGQPSDLNLSRNQKNNSLNKSKNSSNHTNSINNKLDEENINKSNLSVSLHLSTSLNEKENINSNYEDKENNNININKILNSEKIENNDDKNKEKNIININNNKKSTRFSDENILNIINSTEGTSNKKPEVEFSTSTQKLIDKYINIDLKPNIKTINNSNKNIIEETENALLSPSFVNIIYPYFTVLLHFLSIS